METIEFISKSIQSKRNQNFDSKEFPFEKLELSIYDIRKSRNGEKMMADLLRDGQLQPITINVIKGKARVVNGRTRYIEMNKLNVTHNGIFNKVKVETYENLTELEEDYLNAQINVSQNPLSPDEKIDFVIKHINDLNPKDLAKALGVDDKMFENYIAVAETALEVREAFTPKSDGYGRSSVKVEELGKTVIALEQEGIKPETELLICLGNKFDELNLTRDEKRKRVIKITKKVAEYKNNPILIDLPNKELVEYAVKETATVGNSGDKLPQNSSEKYKIVDDLLKETFDFAIILFSEGLYRIDGDSKVESETKRIIDNVNEIIVVGNEIIKLTEIKQYATSLGKKITIHNDDAIDVCNSLNSDSRRGFIYVNGASLYAQRPQLMNYLKKKYSNSIVAMVMLDLLFGKSQVYQTDRLKEIITVYGGVESFDELITVFKDNVKDAEFKKYANTPQEKYIVIA